MLGRAGGGGKTGAAGRRIGGPARWRRAGCTRVRLRDAAHAGERRRASVAEAKTVGDRRVAGRARSRRGARVEFSLSAVGHAGCLGATAWRAWPGQPCGQRSERGRRLHGGRRATGDWFVCVCVGGGPGAMQWEGRLRCSRAHGRARARARARASGRGPAAGPRAALVIWVVGGHSAGHAPPADWPGGWGEVPGRAPAARAAGRASAHVARAAQERRRHAQRHQASPGVTRRHSGSSSE